MKLKNIKRKMKCHGGIAISQIFILVVGIIAISYAIGSEVEVVSADLKMGGEFTYKNFKFVIKSKIKVIQKGTTIQYIKSSDNPCKTKWFWDVNKNGEWDQKEQDEYDKRVKGEEGLKVCMLQSFVTAMEGAKVPDEEDGEVEEKQKEAPPEHRWWGWAYPAGTEETTTMDPTTIAVKAMEYYAREPTAAEVAAEAMKKIEGDETKTCRQQGGKKCERADEKCIGIMIVKASDLKGEICCKGKCEKITEVEEPSPEDKEAKNFTWFDAIWAGATQAGKVYAGVKGLGMLLGLDESLVDAASLALGAGAFVQKFLTTSLSKEGRILDWFEKSKFKTKLGWSSEQFSLRAGVAVAVIIFLIRYKQKDQEIISFECRAWEAPTGGSNCHKCNEQGILTCSEYQCRSLGQSCELLNKGTDEEKCVWVNKNDVTYPTIEPWEDALLDVYEYVTQNTGISPPDRGVKVEHKTSTTGCVKAFTPLSFGIILDEPAKCKIDYIRKESFDDMDFYFGGSSLHRYNHTQIMSLPGSAALEAEGIEIENDGNYELYVRCQDANGNSNPANFVFKFCVEKGPDTTPPLIVGTTPLNGWPITYNKTSFDIEVYVNEPSDCMWSHTDKDYNNMEENMSCSSSVTEMNAQMLYTCTTTLTGLKSRQDNKFYFRCKDQPIDVNESDRNVNIESYEFTLIGTQPLIIDYVKPENGSLIKDSTESVKVTLEAKTSAGYKEGEARCEFGETSDGIVDDQFTPSWTHQHSYDLWLPEGDYEYFIRCYDLGGNPDYKTMNFEVETDLAAPVVVRAYHEETYLKLVTNEPARCVYDVKYEYSPCDYDFEDGISLTTVGEDDVNHYTDWNTKITFYIKCQDEYGIQPDSGCSIIVRPFESY